MSIHELKNTVWATLGAAALLALTSCGSSDRSGLFEGGQVHGKGGGASSGTGGTSAGFGGSVVGSGGDAGIGNSGGSAGNGNSGGSSGSGGSAGGGAGGAAGAAGAPGCDFGGTWASYVSVPVSWPATPFVLRVGSGNLQQWNLSHQKQQDALTIAVEMVPCSIILPDLQGDVLGGFAKFGIRFPNPIFDDGGIPWNNFILRASVSNGQIQFQSDTFATIIGHKMTDATTAPWPDIGGLQPVDHDADRQPGITVIPATGQGYSQPPIDVFATARANRIYIASRTVSTIFGTVSGCDEINGGVNILTIGGTPGINSTIVGCQKSSSSGQGSAECEPADAQFINQNRPQFTPTAAGTITIVRMPEKATCADVRAKFPPK